MSFRMLARRYPLEHVTWPRLNTEVFPILQHTNFDLELAAVTLCEIRLVYAGTSHLLRKRGLSAPCAEARGLVAEPEAPRPPRPRVPHETNQRKRRWPSYQLCVKGAPPIHQGDRPDISKADFTFCMTAIDWGWSVEATAERLLQESTKARENGERYALTTARNAAAAVERRGQPVKSTPHP